MAPLIAVPPHDRLERVPRRFRDPPRRRDIRAIAEPCAELRGGCAPCRLREREEARASGQADGGEVPQRLPGCNHRVISSLMTFRRDGDAAEIVISSSLIFRRDGDAAETVNSRANTTTINPDHAINCRFTPQMRKDWPISIGPMTWPMRSRKRYVEVTGFAPSCAASRECATWVTTGALMKP